MTANELRGADGLGQVIVHAGLEAALAVLLHRVCGQRDDRQVSSRGLLAASQGFDHLESVQFGHLDVEEHQVEGAVVQGFEGLAPIARDDDVVTSAAQEVVDELLVEVIVLGQQDAQPGRGCGRFGGDRGAAHPRRRAEPCRRSPPRSEPAVRAPGR